MRTAAIATIPAMLAVVAMLVAPSRAAASLHVLCYGDSITAGDMRDPEGSYPGMLQRQRADLDVVNEGQPGDVTENIERFRDAIATWSPELVILMMGVNDPMCDPAVTRGCASATATPERTVANLLHMAAEARQSGASVVILTPTPVVCQTACQARPETAFAMAVRQAFTARVAEELLHTRPPPGVRIADLRGKFSEASWDEHSSDGLHPNGAGIRRIAELAAAQIPRPGAQITRPGAAQLPRAGASRTAASAPQATKPGSSRTTTSQASEADPFVRQPQRPRRTR